MLLFWFIEVFLRKLFLVFEQLLHLVGFLHYKVLEKLTKQKCQASFPIPKHNQNNKLKKGACSCNNRTKITEKKIILFFRTL